MGRGRLQECTGKDACALREILPQPDAVWVLNACQAVTTPGHLTAPCPSAPCFCLAELADVRYFTLASIARLARQAQQAASAPAAGAAAGKVAAAGYDSGADEERQEGFSEDEAAEASSGGGEEGGQVSPADLVRTLHDLLAEMPAVPAGMGAPGAAAAAKLAAALAGGEGEEGSSDGEEDGGLKSWCGAAEVGIVAAANTGEGSRQRKRQRLLQEQQAAKATAAAGEQQRAKWASPKAQQRAYRWVWG